MSKSVKVKGVAHTLDDFADNIQKYAAVTFKDRGRDVPFQLLKYNIRVTKSQGITPLEWEATPNETIGEAFESQRNMRMDNYFLVTPLIRGKSDEIEWDTRWEDLPALPKGETFKLYKKIRM